MALSKEWNKQKELPSETKSFLEDNSHREKPRKVKKSLLRQTGGRVLPPKQHQMIDVTLVHKFLGYVVVLNFEDWKNILEAVKPC